MFPAITPRPIVAAILLLALATALAACSRATEQPPVFESVTVGQLHACGLTNTGSAICWGQKTDHHQTDAPSDKFTLISAGPRYNCGIRTDATIKCWGDPFNGITTPPQGTFTALITRATYACGLRTDKTITCWGRDDDSLPPQPPAATYKALADQCSLRTDDSAHCWHIGTIPLHQTGPLEPFTSACILALNNTMNCKIRITSSENDFPPGPYQSIDPFHPCLITEDHRLYCYSEEEPITTPPGQFKAFSMWVNPYAQYIATLDNARFCAITMDGAPLCWGSHSHLATTPPQGTFTQISAAGPSACAVRTNGSLECWGYTPPTSGLPPEGTFISVSADTELNCALATDHSLHCWGKGADLAPKGRYIHLAGAKNGCAIRPDNTAQCWKIHTSTFFPYREDIPVPQDIRFLEMAPGLTGDSTTYCGITTDHDIFCNYVSPYPTELKYNHINKTRYASCAVTTDHVVICHGAYGKWFSNPPIYMSFKDYPTNFAQALPGAAYGCGIKLDQSISCWDNNFDQDHKTVHPRTRRNRHAPPHHGKLDHITPPKGKFTELVLLLHKGDPPYYYGMCGIKTDGTIVCSDGPEVELPPWIKHSYPDPSTE